MFHLFNLDKFEKIAVVIVISVTIVILLFLTIFLKFPNLADPIKTSGEIAQYWLTTVAIIIAGWWAYFNFVKGRTYAAKLTFDITFQELVDLENNEPVAIIRVKVKNIGKGYVDRKGCFVKLVPITRFEDSQLQYTKNPIQLRFFENTPGLESEVEMSEERLIRVSGARLFKATITYYASEQKWAVETFLPLNTRRGSGPFELV